MKRLLHVIAYTNEIQPLKHFYRDALGLTVGIDGPFFVQFDNEPGEASLGLLAVQPSQPREIELCFESHDIETDVATLRARGLEFSDEIRHQEFGKVIHFRDPEGNLLSLLQPVGGSSVASDAERNGGLGTGAGTATAVAVSTSPKLSTAIINCRDVAATKSFYRDRLGLHLVTDSPWWMEFEAGATRLALHPRVDAPEREGHHGQEITLGFAVSDLIAWADEARSRGVHFTATPIDEGFGLFADAMDPEGNEITFREPEAPAPIEEQLAEEFEDEDTPHQVSMHRPVKPVKAVSHVAIKPEYHVKAVSKPKSKPAEPSTVYAERPIKTRGSAKGSKLRVAAKARTGTASSTHERSRPATGRLKKAERRTLEQKKRAVAVAGKKKPVKRAAAKRAAPKRSAPKRATAKRAAPKRSAAKRAAPKRSAAKRSKAKRSGSKRGRKR